MTPSVVGNEERGRRTVTIMSRSSSSPFSSFAFSSLLVTRTHARGPPLQSLVALLIGASLHAVAGSSEDGYNGFTLWLCISLLFLIDDNVGSVTRKSSLRVLGTCVGGALALPLMVAVKQIRGEEKEGECGVGCEFAAGALLATSVALVSFLCRCYKNKFKAKYQYGFVVCELTFVVCGVGGFYKEEPLMNTLERVLSVAVAVVIALCAAKTVTPIYASDAVRNDLAEATKEIRDVLDIIVDVYLNFSFEGGTHRDDDGDGVDDDLSKRLEKDSMSKKQQSAVSRLSRAGALISAAEVEFGKSFDAQEYRILVHGLNRLYNATIAMLFPLESGSVATELVRKHKNLIEDVHKQLNVALTAMSETAAIENHDRKSEEFEDFFSAMTDGAVNAKLCSDILERALDAEEASSGRRAEKFLKRSLMSPSLYTFTQFVRTYAHVTTYVLICVSRYKPTTFDKIADALDESDSDDEDKEGSYTSDGEDTNSDSSKRKYKYEERRSSMKYFTKTRLGRNNNNSNDSNV